MTTHPLLQHISHIDAITDSNQLQKYGTDSSGIGSTVPSLVLRPTSTEELASCVRACAQAKQPYTVQGGLTGLAGGSRPNQEDIVINLERMNTIEEIDTVGGTAIVQAGVILENIQQAVWEEGWYFPLDLGARGSCLIGGNVSTNAGGNRVLRYGTTRELVLGVEVVLPDGTVLNMLKRLLKNNTGFDLKHLFIGTEGRYGIISRVCLRLFPRPEVRYSVLVALQSFANVTELLKRARGVLPELSSFEVMWDNYIKVASQVIKKAMPFEGKYPFYVLVEVEGAKHGLHEKLISFLEGQLEQSLIADVIIPQSEEQSKALWHIRDASAETMKLMPYCIAFDIAIPLKTMEAFIDQTMAAIYKKYPETVNLLFGHLGDGNLHLLTCNVAKEELLLIEELVYQIAAEYNGSITAEHGIGRIKKPFLHYSRSAEEVALMESIRGLINADNLLNAGRVID